MDVKTYQECALRTMANQNTIRQRLYDMGSPMTQLENGIRGLTNEVGELVEITKRCIEYGKGPVDVVHIKEEVGDCFWRLRQICNAVGLTFEECMQANIDKLKIRYPKEFSDINAHEENRDRAGERKVMEVNASESPCPHKVIDMGGQKIVTGKEIGTCLSCGKKVAVELAQGCLTFPTNLAGLEEYIEDHEQTTQGWAEPAEDECLVTEHSGGVLDWDNEHESPSKVRVTDNSVPTVVRKQLNHSYTRYCSCCEIQPIHKSNSVGVCTPCFMKHGESKAD